MTNKSTLSHKLSGSVFVLMALDCLIIVIKAHSNMVSDESGPFVIKYSLIITIVSAVIFSFIFGILTFVGYYTPYMLTNDKLEKSKPYVLFAIFFVPIFSPMTIEIFMYSKSTQWKILWSIMVIFLLFNVIDNLKTYFTKSKDITQQLN